MKLRHRHPRRGTRPGNLTVLLDADVDHEGGVAWSTPIVCSDGIIGRRPRPRNRPRAYRGDTTTTPLHRRSLDAANTCSSATRRRLQDRRHARDRAHPGSAIPTRRRACTARARPPNGPRPVMNSLVRPPARHAAGRRRRSDAVPLHDGIPGTADGELRLLPGRSVGGRSRDLHRLLDRGALLVELEFRRPGVGTATFRRSRAPRTPSPPRDLTFRLTAANPTATGIVSKTVHRRRGDGACVPSATTLCLKQRAFRVTAGWRKLDGTTGPGTGVSLTNDSGYFWSSTRQHRVVLRF